MVGVSRCGSLPFPQPTSPLTHKRKTNGSGGAVRKNDPKRTPKRVEEEGYQVTELACASVYQRSRKDKKSEKKKSPIRSPDKRRGPTSVLHGVCDTAIKEKSRVYIYIYAPTNRRKKRISKSVLSSERLKRPASFLCLRLCVCGSVCF